MILLLLPFVAKVNFFCTTFLEEQSEVLVYANAFCIHGGVRASPVALHPQLNGRPHFMLTNVKVANDKNVGAAGVALPPHQLESSCDARPFDV